jgi:hypothetical protein
MIVESQEGFCALSNEPLDSDSSLIDTDRILPKSNSGIYTFENTRIVEPVAHMKRHDIYRERTPTLDELKSLFDDRVQVMKLLLKINNQLLAYKRRTDYEHPETSTFLEKQLEPIQVRLNVIDKHIEQAIKSYPDKLVKIALEVSGLGPITIIALTTYIDLTKASTPSALWKYVGLDKSSHERYSKGVAGGGNKTLRTVLWNTANVMTRMKDGAYREVYDRTKLRLSVSEKVVKTRNTQGHLVESAWKDTKPSHRHGAALRAVMKHILADYWLVGRTLLNLSTVPLYAEAMLGHTHIIDPEARGWKFR